MLNKDAWFSQKVNQFDHKCSKLLILELKRAKIKHVVFSYHQDYCNNSVIGLNQITT